MGQNSHSDTVRGTRIHDITAAVRSGMAVWPGSPAVELERIRCIEEGSASNDSALRMGVHTGTHVDAPLHFLPSGDSVDRLPLDVLIGPCVVVDTGSTSTITEADLNALNLPRHATRLLLKTRNSRTVGQETADFVRDFAALDSGAAQWLVQRRIRLVGIDGPSIQRFYDATPRTHLALLKNGVVIVEGLRLESVHPGSYQLICLPLKLTGAEAAPARVVVMELEE